MERCRRLDEFVADGGGSMMIIGSDTLAAEEVVEMDVGEPGLPSDRGECSSLGDGPGASTVAADDWDDDPNSFEPFLRSIFDDDLPDLLGGEL